VSKKVSKQQGRTILKPRNFDLLEKLFFWGRGGGGGDSNYPEIGRSEVLGTLCLGIRSSVIWRYIVG
jgi:hypothetical protein